MPASSPRTTAAAAAPAEKGEYLGIGARPDVKQILFYCLVFFVFYKNEIKFCLLCQC
jgi:hypothetical protein